MICLIVACDPSGVIAMNDTIPWRIPEDTQFFKMTTTGFYPADKPNSIIMGRKTWETIRKPLPNRMNFVISRTPQDANTDNPFGPFWCSSLEESVERSKQYNNTYIIGGEQIYKLALEKNIVEKIILSRINTHYEGNKYFHVPDGWNIKDKVKYKEFDVLYLEK